MFRSKTCRSIFGSLTSKKQREWINNFVAEIESSLDVTDQKCLAIKQVTLTELTNQPYAGQFLIYQLFEESSSPDELLITKARKNLTDFDLI